MKTMKTVANDFLLNKKTSEFEDIWNEVKKELLDDWKKLYPKTSENEISKVKIGELYSMLTSNGEFIRDTNELWSLSEFYTYEDVQKMKINVGDLGD
ncbi:MAG: hypothetical protein HRT99_02650 [Mycoplasmatales bacterium]|nr:hypothetical protein [Mycoplasmatales bacterium]